MSIKGKFDVDVYDCTVLITITKSIRTSVNYYLRKYNGETINFEPSGYFCNPRGDRIGMYYIFFHEDDVTSDVINHEKSHLVEQILIDRDIKPEDEVRAYLDGHISKMMDSFFRKKKIKVKNRRSLDPS